MNRSIDEDLRPAKVVERYARAIKGFLNGSDARSIDHRAMAAWDRTYETHGRPDRVLTPPEAEAFLLSWQEELREEMRGACADVSKADLFFRRRIPAGRKPRAQ